MTIFLERLLEKLPIQILDKIFLHYIDDIELKILLKISNKIKRNNFHLQLEKKINSVLKEYCPIKKRLIYYLNISISKGYQIKINIKETHVEVKTKLIVFNQDMYYQNLGKLIY
tara:strand:+ start:181 stop:522 length:342 start_codon:yes stop_codon:yes gene_type:complete